MTVLADIEQDGTGMADMDYDRSLWKISAHAGPLGFGIDLAIPYRPGLLVDILTAEIVDPLTLLFQKVLHVSEFVGQSPPGVGGSGKAVEELSVQELRDRLDTAKVPGKPVPLRVTGVFSTAVLLSRGWWERSGPGVAPVGRNDIQRWTYAGFEEWGPSLDFTSEDDSDSGESFFLGQLGHGDEADSMLVVVTGKRAREIRPGILDAMRKDHVGALSVELTGLLCHRSHLVKRNPQLGAIARHWHDDFNYCLLLDSANHRIWPVPEQPDFYSAYLWKCLWDNQNAPKDQIPRLNDCYLIWEHTDLTRPDAIKYNLDSLQRKELYLRREYGPMELLQKSGPLVPDKPALTSETFRQLFGTVDRMDS